MKARRALVVLAALVVALALAPASRADFGYSFTPTASDVTLGGDVTGPANANSAVKINGSSVVAGGALTTGNVLQVNGASSTQYAALNLGGGAGYVTGSLPAGNQIAQTMGGDVTGTTGSSTVAKIQGQTVSSGSLTEGYALFATSTSNWGQTAFSGDFTCSSSTPGLCTIANVTAPNTYTITPCATVTTTNATPATIYTEPSESASTTYDFVGTLGGQNASTGDFYRADYAFDYQRVGSAAPTAVGTAMVALNVRGSTTGLTYPGLTLAVSSNTVVFSVTGLSATTIIWNLCISREHYP